MEVEKEWGHKIHTLRGVGGAIDDILCYRTICYY